MVTTDAATIAGLGQHLGQLATGRPADLLVLQRTHDDAYEAVCHAHPVNVELVTIGGDLAYGRTDWVQALAADPTAPTFERVLAWGRPMTLDLSYHATPDASSQTP
jgi:adenine deaminase